jgi:hypothetical protein
MQEVVPAVEQVVTGVLLQFTLFPLVVLVVPLVKETGVVPRREMINPWQYPPEPGFVDLPAAGIGPCPGFPVCEQAPCELK